MLLAYRKTRIENPPELLTNMLLSLEKSKGFVSLNNSMVAPEGSVDCQLGSLRLWHFERMCITHDKLLNQAGYQDAAEFILKDVYAGFSFDISKVASQIERALPVAFKIFPTNVLETAALALELNVITHEIDASLSKRLFKRLENHQICAQDYTVAYCDAGIHQARVRQIELSIKLAGAIDQYLNKKWLFHAFKLAKLPARKAGIIDLYEFLSKAFNVLANVPNLCSVVCEIAQLEWELSQKLSKGDARSLSNDRYRSFLQQA